MTDENTPPLGLVCHRCGCRHFFVVYTRPKPNGVIIRRRECRHCGTRIMTCETKAGQVPSRKSYTDGTGRDE